MGILPLDSVHFKNLENCLLLNSYFQIQVVSILGCYNITENCYL